MLKWASKIFGDSNERELKQHRGAVEEVNALEADVEGLADDELRGKTDEFRSRLAEGEKREEGRKEEGGGEAFTVFVQLQSKSTRGF